MFLLFCWKIVFLFLIFFYSLKCIFFLFHANRLGVLVYVYINCPLQGVDYLIS